MGNVPNSSRSLITTANPSIVPPGAGAKYGITYNGVSNIVLPAPIEDDINLLFTDESGHAHTITCTPAGSPPSAGLNGGTTNNKLTFNGTPGSSAELISRNGFWWAYMLNGVTVS